MGDTPRPVKIQATYWIAGVSSSPSEESDGTELPPTRIQSFGPSSPITADNNATHQHTQIDTLLRMGLPVGATPDKNRKSNNTTDDSSVYTGLHDQGPLPPLKEGGPMAVLVLCLQEAKNFNDRYLTEVISTQRKTETTKANHVDKNDNINSTDESGSTNPLKRAKVDGDGSNE